MVVLVLLVGWLYVMWFMVSWEVCVALAFIRELVSGRTVDYAEYVDMVKQRWMERMRREYLDER